jgi:hypothetical protein
MELVLTQQNLLKLHDPHRIVGRSCHWGGGTMAIRSAISGEPSIYPLLYPSILYSIHLPSTLSIYPPSPYYIRDTADG